MKVSDYIAEFLERNGVTTVFELSGGMIAHLLDSLGQNGRIRVVSMHHEQGAAFAADAFGRMTGRPGVAMATSGPGAINLLTGVGSCYFDGSPGVFITGQVNRHEQKGDRAIRQLGFQETDIVSMARPITKAAWLVREVDEVPVLLEKAFRLSCEGRPGPVIVDIPMDIQRSEISLPVPIIEPEKQQRGIAPPESAWLLLQKSLKAAKRPLILAGGGVRSGRAAELFRQFTDTAGVPVVHSLMGVDLLAYDHPLRVGMIGSYGNRWANWALGSADFLLVLGSRLDVRQTGSETAAFKGDRDVFHVDCEAGEINNRVTGCTPILSHIRDFLAQGLGRGLESDAANIAAWRNEINSLRAKWPDTSEIADVAGINPNTFIHQLSQAGRAAATYVVDVGQHQMWAAQSVELTASQRFLTSGGMGSMGFGLPAAVGAALAAPDQPVVVIAGDGGFQCNIQELETVVRNRLPLKMVVINNRCHGMVRQFQQSYFDSRYQSTLWGYSAPDFARVAEAYGIPGQTIATPEEVGRALNWLWEKPGEPALLQVHINTLANVYPKIAFGRPITEMEPAFKPVEAEGT